MDQREQPVLTFCHLRKTGGITFNQILRREFGLRHLDAITRYPDGKNIYREQDLRLDLWVYPGIKSMAGHGVRPFLDYGEFAKRMRWITILRDPVERYASHFIHHVEHFGYSDPFEVWMDIPKHQNDQTVTLAGQPDIEKAKNLLESFLWVGFTEDYIESMKMLEVGTDFCLSTEFKKRSNVAKGKRYDKRELIKKHRTQIEDRNRLDIELYAFARSVIWPRQQQWLEQSTGETRRPRAQGVWPNRLKRNLIYKPFLIANRILGHR